MVQRGEPIAYRDDKPVAWIAAEETATVNQSNEVWLPRCPKCAEANLMIAPANGFTKFLIAKVEVYCQHCQWRGVLAEHMKQVYVRS